MPLDCHDFEILFKSGLSKPIIEETLQCGGVAWSNTAYPPLMSYKTMDEIVKIETKAQGRVAVVGFASTCVSEADSITAMSKSIKKFIDEKRPRWLVFDFSGVKFFSSQVLGLLLDIRAAMKATDGQIVISAIDPQLHRVFKITNLDKIFTFFQDQDTAIKSFSEESSQTQNRQQE